MKRGFNLEMPDLRLVAIFCAGLTTLGSPAFALTLNNPYEPIVGRNVFALKPPTPVNPTNTTPVIAPAGVELQGLTTILGRPQVLLKIKLLARPPEPAKDHSVVLDVGQREGEVEVLAIDMAAGAVQLRNQGKEFALNMKDDAVKPASGPALPGAVPLPGGVPQVPAPGLRTPGTLPPAPAPVSGIRPPGQTTVNTIGGGSGLPLPARQMRANTSGMNPGAQAGAGIPLSGSAQSEGYQPPNTGLSVEEQMAILAVQKEANADGTAAMLPPLPAKYQPK